MGEGLLDFLKTPAGQGLLGAVAGGMAGARKGQPWNTAGAAGLGGLLAYNQGVGNQMDQKKFGIQQASNELRLAEEQRKRQAIEAYRNSIPEADRGVFDVAPDEYIKSLPQLQRPQKENLPWYVRKGADGSFAIDPAYADLERTKSSLQAPKAPPTPFYQVVPTTNGLGRFNARTGQFELIEGGGVTKPSDSPVVQGQITGAKEGAKAGVERQVEMDKNVRKSDQFLSNVSAAEKLLDMKPTQSGIGAALDATGRMVGVSTKGSQTAAELEALSGWMVANVPRMEGPQSNFDLQNYQTMAGKIGDRTVPITERKAALRTVRALQEKYKGLNQPAQQPSAPAAPKFLGFE